MSAETVGEDRDGTDRADAALIAGVANAVRDWRAATGRDSSNLKLVREAVWFYWELPRLPRPLVRQKYPTTVPWSPDARAAYLSNPRQRGGLVIEHSEPMALLVRRLLESKLDTERALAILDRPRAYAVITTAESRQLDAAGVGRSLPPGDTAGDPLARYRAAGWDLAGFKPLADELTGSHATSRSPGPSGHRARLKWRGRSVTTLEDLLRPELTVVIVGINPSPVSVAAGHYYQGRIGQRLWERLRYVGLLPDEVDGFEDDAAFAAGVGFTDVIKRPSVGAKELTRAEFEHGRTELERKLDEIGAPLVVFAFKQSATTLLGSFQGNGFVRGLRLGRSEVFVMPGPYENRQTAQKTLDQLRRWVKRQRR